MMNPPVALPVSPAQLPAKIDEVLERLHRLALESGGPHPQQGPLPPGLHPNQVAPAQMQQMMQLQQQRRDTDSVSSNSSISHSHSLTLSGTTLATAASSASSSPSAASPYKGGPPYNPSQQMQYQSFQPRQHPLSSPAMLSPPQQQQQHQQVNPNLANVGALYRLGMPSRLQAGGSPVGGAYGPGGPMTPPPSSMDAGTGFAGVQGGGNGAAANMMGVGSSGKAYSYRPGDWICVSPACSYPNFGRNEFCNACRCPRPTSGNMPRGTPPAGLGMGYPHGPGPVPDLAGQPPRFSGAPRLQGLGMYPPGIGMGMAVPGIPTPSVSGMAGLAAPPGMVGTGVSIPGAGPVGPDSSRSPMIVTPSGRAFASAGQRKNVSGDDANPVVMFWPDNEPLPEPGQVRPNMLGLPQPPILNTGNKGPIEHQPGDWYCQKCEHLNWRRRKVCQNCYRFAEGNEDDTTLARQAECISVLIAQLVAAKKAQEAGVLLNLNGVMGVPSDPASPDGDITPGVGAASGPEKMDSAGGFFTHSNGQVDRMQMRRLVPMGSPPPPPAPAVLRGSSGPSVPPVTRSLYTPPALAAAQAFEPSYATQPFFAPPQGHKPITLSTPPAGRGASSPISPIRMSHPASIGLTPINTSPTSLRASISTAAAVPIPPSSSGGSIRRVSPPMTPLDPPRSARTNISNIWGPTSSSGSSASPPSKWPDFGGGRRLTPPQAGGGTPSASPRGSVAESATGSGSSGFSDSGVASLGGKVFNGSAGAGASAGPVGSPVVTAAAPPPGLAFRSSHPRLAGLHRP